MKMLCFPVCIAAMKTGFTAGNACRLPEREFIDPYLTVIRS